MQEIHWVHWNTQRRSENMLCTLGISMNRHDHITSRPGVSLRCRTFGKLKSISKVPQTCGYLVGCHKEAI
jgi:hypothetical protein